MICQSCGTTYVGSGQVVTCSCCLYREGSSPRIEPRLITRTCQYGYTTTGGAILSIRCMGVPRLGERYCEYHRYELPGAPAPELVTRQRRGIVISRGE